MLQRSIVFFLCLVCVSVSFSQSDESDASHIQSQFNELGEEWHDSLYYELAKLYRRTDQDSTLYFLKQSLQYSIKYEHPVMSENACFGLQVIYSRKGEMDSLYKYLKWGNRYAEQNGSISRQVIFNNNLGLYFKDQYQYDSALAYYFTSLEKATDAKLTSDQVVSYNNIGTIYYLMQNFEESSKYFSSSMSLVREHNLEKYRTMTLLNLAVSLVELKNYQEAINLLNELENACQNGECSDEEYAKLYYNLGYSQYEQGQMDLAEANILKSFTYSASQYPELKGRISETYANLLLLKGEFDQADSLLSQSLSIAIETGDKILKKRVYERLSDYHEQIGDLSKSLLYYKLFSQVKDSLFNETLAKNIRDIHLDVKQREAMAIISEKDSELERSKLVNLLIAAVAMLSAIIIFLMMRVLGQNKKAKALLEEQVKKRTIDLQRRNEELAASHKQYDHLIYRTSHDIRGPISTLLGLTYLAQLELKRDIDKKDLEKYLLDIENTARGLSNTLSKFLIIDKVRNQEIVSDTIQIKPFLQSLVQPHIKDVKNKDVSFKIDVDENCRTVLTDTFLLEIILSSLLDNAFFYKRRSEGKPEISLTIQQEDGRYHFTLSDNGIGIESHALPFVFDLFFVASEKHGSGLGLFLANTAVGRLGGKIEILSGNQPTIFQFSLPVVEAEVEQTISHAQTV